MSDLKLLMLGIVFITIGTGVSLNIFLIGFGTATDIPFVFSNSSSNVAGYSSYQLEALSHSSPDLAGVPVVSTPSDNATLNFPVVGGGNRPQRTSEKKVDDLKKLFDSRVETILPYST